MGSHTLTFPCLLSFLLLLFPVLSSSQRTFIRTRATYYGSPNSYGNPSGACGYGEYGRNMNGGAVGAVARLYRNGTGCGACYQVRCTNPQLCREAGVVIAVTDYGQGDNTDFILSGRGFAKLALPDRAADLMTQGAVDVEFRRVSCRYPGYNMMFMIKEQSKYPDYLALIPIYQGGQKDILDVQIWQEDYKEWRGMRRAYGGVWDMSNPPRGPLTLRFLAGSEYGRETWIQVNSIIPSDWKAGVAYDADVQLI